MTISLRRRPGRCAGGVGAGEACKQGPTASIARASTPTVRPNRAAETLASCRNAAARHPLAGLFLSLGWRPIRAAYPVPLQHDELRRIVDERHDDGGQPEQSDLRRGVGKGRGRRVQWGRTSGALPSRAPAADAATAACSPLPWTRRVASSGGGSRAFHPRSFPNTSTAAMEATRTSLPGYASIGSLATRS